MSLSNEYITPKEIATILGVSDQAVYDWLQAGLIPYKKPTKLYFIKRSDFDAFLNGDER